MLTNILSLWPERPSSNLEIEGAPPNSMAMWKSWPPALAPGMTSFCSTPSPAIHPKGTMYTCGDTHSLHIPAPSTPPASNSLVASVESRVYPLAVKLTLRRTDLGKGPLRQWV